MTFKKINLEKLGREKVKCEHQLSLKILSTKAQCECFQTLALGNILSSFKVMDTSLKDTIRIFFLNSVFASTIIAENFSDYLQTELFAKLLPLQQFCRITIKNYGMRGMFANLSVLVTGSSAHIN